MADLLTPIRSGASPLRLTPSSSPASRSPVRSPTRALASQPSISLRKVIGTTSSGPSGLASHVASRSLAFCAGSAVVFAEVDDQDNVSQRFYKAKPTVLAVNPTVSFYNSNQNVGTPERRRKSLAPTRVGMEAYSPSTSPSRDWNETGGSKTWTSRERIKSATAVSLSPDGRFLAIGETGYSPRVLIFSTAAEAPNDVPVSILSEHSSGIRAIAFSPDSQYLATLGDTNDGFLFVWAINSKSGAAKLLSSNKCTAFINDMSWMGRNVVTVGTRHVKVWRVLDSHLDPPSPVKVSRLTFGGELPASPTPKALQGRNCLLGNLVDSKFTCLAPISETEAVVCTSQGDVCLIDDSENQQRLTVAKNIGVKIQCITRDDQGRTLWLGGRNGTLKREDIDGLRASAKSKASSPTNRQSSVSSLSSTGVSPSPKTDLLALASILGRLVVIDANHSVSLASQPSDEEEPSLQMSLPAHKDAVEGLEVIRTSDQQQGFVTWSRDGSVKCWDGAGQLKMSFDVQLEQPEFDDDLDVRNELKVVRATEDATHFITGDKYGVVRVSKPGQPDEDREVRAHGAETTSIATYREDDSFLFATSGRDRMVQLFSNSKDSLDIVQTIDDHVGAVNNVLFTEEGQRLLSGSSDRTIIIHERISRLTPEPRVVFVPIRVITLKASPMSMTLVPGDQDSLIVSTMNHQIQRFDMSTGYNADSFKTTDSDSNDLIVIHSIKAQRHRGNNQPRILVGVSSTDKSIRVYDLDKGQLLTREFGHCEGVSDVALLEEDGKPSESNPVLKFVTTGLDGTIMIWDFSMNQPQALQEIGQGRIRGAETPLKESVSSKPPLRRVLSRSELAEYMVLDPTGDSASSPSRLRDPSPSRLRRKSSKPNLFPTSSTNQSSPSPSALPNIPETTKKKPLSPTATWSSSTAARNRSPSPPPLLQQSPRTPNLANKPRLRRPPSVPSSLRAISRARGSMSDESIPTPPLPVGMTDRSPPLPTEPQTLQSLGKQLRERLQNFRNRLDSFDRADALEEEKSLQSLKAELELTMGALAHRRTTAVETPVHPAAATAAPSPSNSTPRAQAGDGAALSGPAPTPSNTTSDLERGLKDLDLQDEKSSQ